MEIFDDYITEIRRYHQNVIGSLKISSKTGFNIKEAFVGLIKEIHP